MLLQREVPLPASKAQNICLYPLEEARIPAMTSLVKCGRVLFALIHHWHVDEFVVPFARKELLTFLVNGGSHDRLDDL